MSAAIQAMRKCELASVLKSFDHPGPLSLRWAAVDLIAITALIVYHLV